MTIKGIIKTSFISVGAVIITLILLVLTLIQFPTLLLTEKNIDRAKTYFNYQTNLNLHWKSFLIKSESNSFLKKKFVLEASQLCLDKPPMIESICFDTVRIPFFVNLAKFPTIIESIGPAVLSHGSVSIHLDQSKGSQPSLSSLVPAELFLPFMNVLNISSININLDHWILSASGITYDGNLDLSGKTIDQHFQWEATGAANIHGISFLEGAPLDFSFENHDAKELINFKVKHEAKNHSTFQMIGHLTPNLIKAKISGIPKLFELKPLEKLRFDDCDLAINQKSNQLDQGFISFNCPIHFNISIPEHGIINKFKIPKSHSALFSGEFRMPFPPNGSENWKGEIHAQLNEKPNDLFEITASMDSTIEGIPNRAPDTWKKSITGSLVAKTSHFSNVVAILKNSAWEIPAPLNVLDGEVELQSQGQWTNHNSEIPITLNTKLYSRNQAFNIKGTGLLSLAKKALPTHLTFQAELTNVQIQLPDLSYSKPPKLTSDSRIITQRKQAMEAPPLFTYDLEIQTPQAQPIRLISNLTKDPVPLFVNIRLHSDRNMEGNIRFEQFPLELFNRHAKVEYFTVNLPIIFTDQKKIKGLISVSYTDYTIKILIHGTAEHPLINVTSEPPLPEKQVLAALIFGRPLDELDSSEASSVSSAKAAFADGAIGLASLYLMASTPIESIGYNPETGRFTAKLRVSQGTSLNIGSEQGKFSSLGIRKRLGGYWTATTDISSSTDYDQKVVSAFLEWARRY